MSKEEEKKDGGDLPPPTEMIYYQYEGNFELECDAKILSIVEKTKEDEKAEAATTLEIILDRTVMYAQGGGQPTDIGTLTFPQQDDDDTSKEVVIAVEKVLMNRETGIATHIGKQRIAPGEEERVVDFSSTVVGTTVRVKVDAERRRLLSECHTGGHLVDATMAKCGKLMKPTKGYHYLEGPYVEYEGTIPPNDRPQVLKDLQQAFRELIVEDTETKIETLPETVASEMCNRIAKNFDMKDFGGGDANNPIDIRIVTVAGHSSPCGGTHVKSTGLLKERNWGIIGLKSKKGVVRVRYGQDQAASQ